MSHSQARVRRGAVTCMLSSSRLQKSIRTALQHTMLYDIMRAAAGDPSARFR